MVKSIKVGNKLALYLLLFNFFIYKKTFAQGPGHVSRG